MRHSKLFLSILLTLAAFLGVERSASAQFQIVGQVGSTTQQLSNGGTVTIAASGVGQSQNLVLTLTYNGTGTATLNGAQLVGSSAFAVVSNGEGTLNPGQSTSYVIAFTPASGASASASLTITYNQTTGQNSSNGQISLNLIGGGPNFIFGYSIQPQGNTVSVGNGGTITFPATQAGSSTTAVLTVENTGSAAGTLNSVSVTGSAFTTVGLGLLPATIGIGQALQISVVYTPQANSANTGTIQLVFPGQTVTLNLTGTSSQLQFQVTEGGQTLPVSQNQVTLPGAAVGLTTAVSVTVLNTGSANAIINAISLSGNGFLPVNVPPLPQTIVPGGSINLALTFTPPQAGNFIGDLTVGGVTLAIAATGLGPLYQYSYTIGSAVNPVSPNGSVFFATVQLGQSSSTRFTISNAGTAPGTISGIYIGQANSPFVITGLPPFPLTIGVNQTASFGITFTPTSIAGVSGTLQIDGTAFSLNGAGGAPPPFPSYSFTGPQGTLGPLQQPAITLSLATPYALAVTGTLTITVTPNGFTADPAIQFSTGGKTVAFSIPANTTAAVFANGSTSIALQSGSTSGTITLTPTFQTPSGVSLTPAASQNLQLVVPATAPLLIGAQITASTPAGITLAISGVSNSQTLTQLSFSFTAAANFNLSGATVSIPLGAVATAWFESAAAQPFGGQFVATIPFSFTTGNSGLTTPATAVTSVSITATSAQGTSSPVVVSLP